MTNLQNLSTGNNSSASETLKNEELDFTCHYSYSQRKQQKVFIGNEIAKQLGHTNLTQAIKDAGLIEGKDYVIVKRKDHPDFFEFVTKQNLVTNRTHSITILYESGVDLLTLNSKTERGQKLRRWIVDNVIPSIRENGYYAAIDMGALDEHVAIENQKENSKRVNAHNYVVGGVERIVDYNTSLCKSFTGKTPKEVKNEAKEAGLPSKHRNSAKQVLRHTKPEVACSMSLTDNLVAKGAELKEVAGVVKEHGTPIFELMLKLWMKPKELNQ